MTGKKIKVTIDKSGKPVIEAIGFDGCGCTEATKGIEAALSGGGQDQRIYKPEWNNVNTQDDEEKIHQSW